jgi:signal transduction histidine kinase/ligand-binding sensor domain-containing protein
MTPATTHPLLISLNTDKRARKRAASSLWTNCLLCGSSSAHCGAPVLIFGYLHLCNVVVTRARVLATALLFSACTAWAVDPSTHLTQYSHGVWRIQDGLFAGAPKAIAQTTDGYLWIGTATGLFRFDGVRFVLWTDFAHQKQLASAEVSTLMGARDGSLWIGASYGLFRWKANTLSQYSTQDGFVRQIIETREGAIWLARDRYADQGGALCQVQGRELHCYSSRDGVPLPYAVPLVEDAIGNLWIGGGAKLVRWQPASSTVWTLEALRKSEGLEGVTALAVDRNNSLWVGISHPGSGLGLKLFRDGVWKTFSSSELNGSRLTVSKLFLDRDDALWIGTEDQGIYRIVEGKVDHFGSADGLSGDKITDLFQDHEGTIWVATSKGIDNFRDLPVVTLSRREGLHSDGAQSVSFSSDGTVWIGNVGALDAWRHGAITSTPPKDGLPGQDVTSLLEDPSGGLWLGIDNGLFHFERGKFAPAIKPGGPNIVVAMTNGADGSVWAVAASATTSNLVRIHNSHLRVRQTFPPEESVLALAIDPRGRIWIAGDKLRYLDDSGETTLSAFGPRYGYIRNIAVDGDDVVWFGATKGLVGFRDGQLQAMTTSNGLPCERINALILDNHRSLWLYAQCGLIKIDHSELEKWWHHPDVQVKTTVFDAMDGFQGGPSPFRPAATKSSDGRLWFVNGSVVQTINPDHVYLNELPPPVHIEQFIANTTNYSLEDSIRLAKLSRNIEIKYTALSFVVPQRVRFRYKLDGYDTDWQEAGTRRSAFYTNLRPGTYKFLVIACNDGGVWNKKGAAVTFVVPPAWYQTMWFRLLALLLLALLAYAFYLLRMRQYAIAMRARFNERLDERLRIARELHDTLLQSFHGLMFQFQAARNMLPRRPKSAMQALDEAILTTEKAIAEGRDAIQDLRPELATRHDLAELLTAVGQELAGAHAANGHFPSFGVTIEGQQQRLPPTLQDEIYRIGREVIRNAIQHADARRIEVEIRYDERELRLRIRDDGKGIDLEVLGASGRPGHWGLPGIRERAKRIRSRLEFWTEAGAGTEVELRVPASIAYEKQRGGNRFRFVRRGGSDGGRS